MNFQTYYEDRHYVGTPEDPGDDFADLYNRAMDIDDELLRYLFVLDFVYSLRENCKKTYGALAEAVWELDHGPPAERTQENMVYDTECLIHKIPADQRPVFMLCSLIIQDLYGGTGTR